MLGDTQPAKCNLQDIFIVFGEQKQQNMRKKLLSESVSTCRSCSRWNILIDQAKTPQRQGNACTSIPTQSEQTAGFKAPSAILCSNEGVLGKLGDGVSLLSPSRGSCCPNCGIAGERCCHNTIGARISTKLARGGSSHRAQTCSSFKRHTNEASRLLPC